MIQDMEKVIKEYEDFVNGYECFCTSDDYEYEMHKAVLALLKEQKPHKNSFTVIDKHTGEYPNVVSIARRCKWAKNLIYCDIDQFVIGEDGTLMLTDDCGNVAYCPADRFEVIWDA